MDASIAYHIPCLKLTASLPPNIGRKPKGKKHLPTIDFQGRTVSFREGNDLDLGAVEIKRGNKHVGTVRTTMTKKTSQQ